MKELWVVNFHGKMIDVINDPTPAIDGELVVRGNGIQNVIITAEQRLEMFGFDGVQILGARILESKEDNKKERKENEQDY